MYSNFAKYVNCILPAALAAFLLLNSGCDRKFPQNFGHNSEEQKKKQNSREISDKPLAAFQVKLLDMAFEISSSIPRKPFIKNRSRSQQAVIETCLEMDQPVRAVGYADRIDNWRRGLCYADTAYYLADKSYTLQQIQKGLDLAEQIAEIDHGQQWRSDRIKVRIAQSYILLARPEKAGVFTKDLSETDAGRTMHTEAIASEKDLFDEQIKKLDASIALQTFDITQNALFAYAELFKRYYDDTERRRLSEEKIRASWDKLPLIIRFDLLVKLSECALDHSDRVKSSELVKEAGRLLDDYNWPLEKHIPLSAKLAALSFRTGDSQTARIKLDSALDLFSSRKSRIIDIYRAETLWPLAETYQLIGDNDAALAVYKQAVEECVENPNPRPRAENLSALCCSMALSALEPDAGLWQRINQISAELDQLW